MATGHFGDKTLDQLHVAVDDNTEGGACLTGHETKFDDFKKKVTCNYRYQAYEQAKSHSGITKRLHSYAEKSELKPVKSSAYSSKAGNMTPAWYAAVLDPPDPLNQDWHIGGPIKSKSRSSFASGTRHVKPGHNFTNAQWPYWNNAHHLIPKGTLKSRILEEDGDVAELIQKALLKAKYNVNHKVNMLLMPQDQEVAKVLGLPRHIQLKDDDEPDLEAMCTDHPVYNLMVKEMQSGLSAIIKDYKEICQSAIDDAEDHKVPDAELDKEKLEKLSKTLLQLILDWGAEDAGKSIDAKAKGLMGHASESAF